MRSAADGRRDYAILLLLARLGLRAGEVAAIRLDDVDWRGGELLVRGKDGRDDVLPVPTDVATALVSYLRRRPRVASRALFLRVLAPSGPLTGDAVGGIVRAACLRAGLPLVRSHRLRHTAATEMLKAGASLPEIGEVRQSIDDRQAQVAEALGIHRAQPEDLPIDALSCLPGRLAERSSTRQ